MAVHRAQAQGKSFDDYVQAHQDKSRSAKVKSLEAAFLAFTEDLKADEAAFTAERILQLELN